MTTIADKRRDELVEQYQILAQSFVERMVEEGVNPVQEWSGSKFVRRYHKFLWIIPYSNWREIWVNLAGWQFPCQSKVWLMEDLSVCIWMKSNWYGGFTGRFLGTGEALERQNAVDLPLKNLQDLVDSLRYESPK